MSHYLVEAYHWCLQNMGLLFIILWGLVGHYSAYRNYQRLRFFQDSSDYLRQLLVQETKERAKWRKQGGDVI